METAIPIEHFVYGSFGGYKLKAQSPGVDAGAHTEPFQGFFFPITQADIKTLGEVRVILPAGAASMLLARIVKGPRDDHGRETMANHTAVIPKQMLRDGVINYEDVDVAMAQFEAQNNNPMGSLQPMPVPKAQKPLDVAEIKNYLPKEAIEMMMARYKESPDRKIYLLYRGSAPKQRIKLAYIISMFLDVKMGAMPLSIYTDKPYASAVNVFNLVLSSGIPNIKPGGDWVVLPVDISKVGAGGGGGDVGGALNNIYG